jgi:hypothetical protein
MRDEILNAMKGAAWERAKGELFSLGMMSYIPEHATSQSLKEWQDKCQRRNAVIESFIREMEDDELHLN